MIYGSLFKLAPIEDRRFLIGRDRELAGLEQALSDWDAGRFAACVFVGARGSGKTSLLNCATGGAFAGREVLRTQFRRRFVAAEAIDDFLRELLGLSPDADLQAAFNSAKGGRICRRGSPDALDSTNGAHHTLDHRDE